jgi:heptosyltransferase-2
MNSVAVKKILVIQQKMIGDVLISTVLCSHLKSMFPEAEVHYAIHSGTKAVVQEHPDVHEFVISPAKKSLRDWQRLRTKIRAQHYDLIVDAYGKLESMMMVLGTGAKRVLGHKKWFSPLVYTSTSKPSHRVYTLAGNAIEDRLRLIYPEEKIQEKALEFRPRIYLTHEEISWAKVQLKKHDLNQGQTLVMVSVLGSGRDKSLPGPTMAQILTALAQRPDTHILLNYIPKQKKSVDDILALVPTKHHSRLHPEVYGNNLREFLALLSQVNYLVGNEGGAVNMAKALDIPTFTLFSPWINKSAWNSFDDGQTHIGLHLKDFIPEAFKGLSNKAIRKDYKGFYAAFEFELFAAQLDSFCQVHSS